MESVFSEEDFLYEQFEFNMLEKDCEDGELLQMIKILEDDAKVNKFTLAEDNPSQILSQLDDLKKIINVATCHSYSYLSTYNYSSMTANTSAFHFVPGCEGENFPKKMRCKKESKIIKPIIEKTVNSDDPIKLGITLHDYADTFSHQGFSGI